MPEYLAPGVFVEETSFRAKSIEGVSTSTAGFIGPARFGPDSGEPELLTSFADFERTYGGLDELYFGDGPESNYLAHGVRAFFENGGKRLYVCRVVGAKKAESSISWTESPPTVQATITARFPGRAGNMRVTFAERFGVNVCKTRKVVGETDPTTNKDVTKHSVLQVQLHDMVHVKSPDSPPSGLPIDERFIVTKVDRDNRIWEMVNALNQTLRVTYGSARQDGSVTFAGRDLTPEKERPSIRIVTVDVRVEKPIVRPRRPQEEFAAPEVYEGFSYHASHRRALTRFFAQDIKSRLERLTVPIAIVAEDIGVSPPTPASHFDLRRLLMQPLPEAIPDNGTLVSPSRVLENGSDGGRPAASDYEGSDDEPKTGLKTFEDVEDISIVAAPGSTSGYGSSDQDRVDTVTGLLISHCERMRYRVAVLDAPPGQAVSSVRDYRSKFDSTHAALYYPWVVIQDPIRQEPRAMPPSGFVAGIYARNDIEHGVHKAPANEVVSLAIRFEFPINKGQQEVLNPEGINAFRFFEGRGFRLWGARTISSDPEWKYVNVRRYFAYLERSIEKGTQWVVFENNHEPLWAKVRRTIEDFLFNEWKSERLMGTKPEEGYFVRCDRSTMTQNDLDNGRLICLIGVSVIKPAEFVIFRIGQWTADASN